MVSVTINKETKTIPEWCKTYNIKPNTVYYRIRVLKYSLEDAITKPIKKQECKKVKRLYNIWRNMIDRCYKSNRKDYNYYGAKGIKVCKNWLNNFNDFEEWALSNSYANNLTLERIDNRKDYCPENCKWIDFKSQRLNTSQTLKITISGITKCLKEWCKDLGLNYNMVYMRYKRGKKLLEALNAK
jgi:hypothetical protein